MKLLILLGVLFAGTIFLSPKQKNITGTWVIDSEVKKCESTVLRIQSTEGYFTGSLDIPDQQVYDRPVAIKLEGDSIKIILDKRQTCFLKVALTDSMLAGRSVVPGRVGPVKFYLARKS